MLHTGILPHHTKWAKLFENLRYIVVDELHYYRGVYGSHLANIMRGFGACANSTARTRNSSHVPRPLPTPKNWPKP